ncbi:MAG: hypothetical protein LBK61_03100 [Spirochaetaceae bacterium]|jgi:hypothetical protein|nr:hypothetical protein [Spirochaetaceae bacterium]
MNNKLFFFPFGIGIVLVFLASMSACSRIDLSELFPKQEELPTTPDPADPEDPQSPQTPPSQNPQPPQTPPEQNPQPPVVTSPHYTWYVSSNGSDGNSGADSSSPLASVSTALSHIKSTYRSGKWPSGTSAVIEISGRIVGSATFGANDAMVDISGTGNYPPIILEGDPVHGGILDANKRTTDGRVLYIANSKVTLGKNLVLTGGRMLMGGAVCIGENGTVSAGEFIVDGGEISGNHAGSGGAVMVYKGNMSMLSGVIKNNGNDFNHNLGDGGAVFLMEDTTLLISGGTVSDNGNMSKTINGGGVYVNGQATAIMTGGEILRNTSGEAGGGVYIAPLGTFEMSGGMISGNTSKTGGGVGLSQYGAVFTHTGGTVSGNTPN